MTVAERCQVTSWRRCHASITTTPSMRSWQPGINRTAHWCSGAIVFMAALRSRCRHYIFALWFLLSSIFFGSRPSDHYFRSVRLSVCLSVCLYRVFLSRLWSDFDQTRTYVIRLGLVVFPKNIGAVWPLGAGWPLKTFIFRGFGAQKTISSYSFDRIVLITVARDSGRLLYFGRVIFLFIYFLFFSVHQIFAVPAPIVAKLCHTTRYVLK